jgi:hypothetical protein
MPTVFKHALTTNIGTTPVDALEIPLGVRATVIGCNIANITEYDTIVVDVFVFDDNQVQAAYAKGLIIPPNTSVKVVTQGEKLILPPAAGIKIVSDTESSIDATISYVEIS